MSSSSFTHVQNDMSYNSFQALLQCLDGYIDDLSPYAIDGSQIIFSMLPLELREQIYDYILPPNMRSIHPLKDLLGGDHSQAYALFLVNHATALDVGLWYLRTRQFEITTTASCDFFSEFLSWFPGEQGFLAVRHLEYDSAFWRDKPLRGAPNPNIEFALRCGNVHTIRFRLDRTSLLIPRTAWELATREEMADNRGIMTMPELAAAYRLGRLFSLRKVRRIELRYVHFEWGRGIENYRLLPYPSGLMGGNRLAECLRYGREELKEWMISGFAAAGRIVGIDLADIDHRINVE